MSVYSPEDEARFWSFVDLSNPGGCWPWTGKLTDNGYARFQEGPGRWKQAHPIAWKIAGRDNPQGRRLRNQCGNTSCVNPQHWEPEGSHADAVRRLWKHVDRSGGEIACWPFVGNTTWRGYGLFKTPHGSTNASRFAWEVENGQIPPGLYILHSCDNPLCCNPRHLRAGTHQDNMDDMKARNRSAKGQASGGVFYGDNGGRALTNAQAREVTSRHREGVKALDLAAEYGVSAKVIYELIEGRTYRGAAAYPRYGEASNAYKWTRQTVQEVRDLAGSGMRQAEIARRLRVDPSHVSRIVRGESRRYG